MLNLFQHPPGGWRLAKRSKAQPHRQILPSRVVALDEVDLPLTPPPLDLFLTLDCGTHVATSFVEDEAVDSVAFGKAVERAFAVLVDAETSSA
ncbi:hypothetical protein [Sphingomonas montanisoli]|uniref:hypothetical protein n=1 Tax=Sphingomonas montanisoli TaxID=2606412 RepID=UPI0015E18D12